MMKKRSPKKVLFLHTLTLGLYLFYWCSRSRKEINQILGRSAVPTVWFIAVPFGMFWWAWLYGEALEEATAHQIHRDNTVGMALIAALGAPSPFYIFLNLFSIGSSGAKQQSLSWTVVLIVAILFYIFYTIVLGIFPSTIQSKINKLHSPQSPDPAPITPAA